MIAAAPASIVDMHRPAAMSSNSGLELLDESQTEMDISFGLHNR